MTKTPKLFFVVWLALSSLCAIADDASNAPALTNVTEVRALSAMQIADSPRVQVEAVVTLAIPRRSYFWLQDGRDGIRLYVRRKSLAIQPGDRVLVTGKVVPGETGPMIAPDEVKVLSGGKVPEPASLSAAELNTFSDLDRRVQVDGHVLRVIQKSTRWQIELESGDENFWVELARQTNDPVPPLLDATIRARGICVRQLFEWGEKVRPTLLAQNLADISILRPGNPKALADREHIPVTTIASLTRESISEAPVEIHLRGTVLDQRLGEHLILRDSSGAIEAKSSDMLIVPLQKEVDLWGTPSWDGGHLSLKNATFRLANAISGPTIPQARKTAETKKPATLPVLTKASQLLNLSPEEAAWKYPVHFRGVVTLYYPERRQFFVQDDTGGFYVAGPWNRTDLKTGDLVDVRGVSDPGGFAPRVLPREITPAGTAAFPKPRQATLFQLATGQYDSQWVEIHGVVRSLTEENDLMRLKVSDSDGTVFVDVPTENAPTNLLDSVVRLRGICATHPTPTGQISSLVIWCPSLDFVNVEDWGAANPLDMPPQSIISLNQFRPYNRLQRRVNIEGIVTACQNNKSFFVQDDAAGIEVETISSNLEVRAGDHVVVTGYPTPGTSGVVLREAVFQIARHGEMPQPKTLDSESPLNPAFQNMLVQVDARLRFRTRKTLTLQMPGQIVEVTSPRTLSQTDNLEIGSLLRVTGIYRVITDEARTPVAFQIFAPGGTTVQVLEKPSWWNFRHTLLVIAVLLTLMAGTAFWGIMLRRKVRERTAGLRESESKFRSLVEKSLVGVYIIQNGRFVYANPRLAEMLGYTVEEMLSLKVDDVVAPEDRGLVQDQLRRRLSGEVSTVRYNFRSTRKDNQQVNIEVLGNFTEYQGKPGVLGTAMDITERKRAEEELFESRQMLRTVLDTVPQRVFWKTRDLRFAGCNKAFSQDNGLSDPAEITGKSAYDINTHEAAAKFQEEDLKIMEAGAANLNVERLLTKPDGTERWLKVSKAPLFDTQGKVHGVLGTYEDITEHKQAQIELAHASSLLETLLANSPDYIYFKDRQSRFVRVSNSLAHRFRVPSTKDLIGKTDFDFFHSEHAQAAFDDEQEIIRTGEAVIGKPEKEQHFGGEVSWALTTKQPWRNQEGNIIGTFGISKDVTAIKKAEEMLAHERGLFHALVENLPDAIYFKDRESRFVRLSKFKTERAREELTRRFQTENPDEELPSHLSNPDQFAEFLIGKTDFDISPDRAQHAFDQEREILRTGQPLIGLIEKNVQPDDQKVGWYHTTKMPWRDEEGNLIGTFGVTRDITALKDAEAKLEEAHQRLLETSRLAGMAEVATDVLHNVGNVLNSVNISCSLTIDQIKNSKVSSLSRVSALIEEHRGKLGEFFTLDPRGQQIPSYLTALAENLSGDQTLFLKEMEQLLKHIDHIKQIVAMQQSYAKVAGIREMISVNQLVEDALQINAAALARHDVHVRREITETPLVSTEKHKVLQILVNLIRNAKYAMDEARRADKLLTIRVGSDDDGVKIEIIDNGVGIPKENLTRIFGHGFTTRQNGHGFGLHSSALAVRELGGSLDVYSDGQGTGATFTLILPTTTKPNTQSEPKRYEPVSI